MKLNVKKRAGKSKSELTHIRHHGDIPAVLYHKENNVQLTINGPDFQAALRKMPKGHLPTTQFELVGDGFKEKVIVKEIQYHPTTYKILHIDLKPLEKGLVLNVNVPVDYVGINDCEGIKLGGFLREVLRHVTVRCDAANIPQQFTLDVSAMQIGHSKRVRDLDVPKGVTVKVRSEEVVGLIAKR